MRDLIKHFLLSYVNILIHFLAKTIMTFAHCKLVYLFMFFEEGIYLLFTVILYMK